MKPIHKENIIKLRAEGKTYDEIKDILGCSKSTIAYHCGKGQKEKTRKRTNVIRNSPHGKVKQKTDNYQYINKKIRNARHLFHNRPDKANYTFSVKDVFALIEHNPKCYLTGRTIDINDTDSYSFDHMKPKSKGGENDLSNLGITCREANKAKSDLMLEDFIILCKDVLENFGYTVSNMAPPVGFKPTRPSALLSESSESISFSTAV